jgi:RimJ/RimL family protein N-acetyltransferase
MTDMEQVKLRPASVADSDLLLTWRNDLQTRLASRNSALVTREEHQVWLSRMLASTDHVMQIAEADGSPVGVVRGDRTPQGWELSWTVAPEARGRGIGRRMLTMFVAALEGRLVAVVHKDNIASARMASTAGLICVGPAGEPGFEQWVRD